ncbi:MAG: glutamate--tRNA ligase, partial [Veillonella sp.]|nr:glutamate--tRNA ligase [Veillonella sp.]
SQSFENILSMTRIDEGRLKINKNMEVLDEASAKAMLKEIQKEHGIKGKNLFMGSRISLTGQMHGPDLNNIVTLLGKEKTLKRLESYKNLI